MQAIEMKETYAVDVKLMTCPVETEIGDMSPEYTWQKGNTGLKVPLHLTLGWLAVYNFFLLKTNSETSKSR